MGEVCKDKDRLFFHIHKWIRKKYLNINVSKAYQNTDIPSKIITVNTLIFVNFLHCSFNTCVSNSEFPSVLKQSNVIPIF